MSKRRLRPGDQVVVIAGNDRGRSGKVLSCNENRIVVEGVNVRKKHMRKSQENQKGQIIDIECPVDISNVMLEVDGKAVKLRSRQNKGGVREFFYLNEGKEVLYRSVKKPKS